MKFYSHKYCALTHSTVIELFRITLHADLWGWFSYLCGLSMGTPCIIGTTCRFNGRGQLMLTKFEKPMDAVYRGIGLQPKRIPKDPMRNCTYCADRTAVSICLVWMLEHISQIYHLPSFQQSSDYHAHSLETIVL